MTPVLPPGAEPVSIVVEVGQVTEYPPAVGGAFRAPFSVVFHGPLEPIMAQGTYRLEHEQFGVTELFLVPIGPEVATTPGHGSAAMRYEAVFG